MKPSIVFISPGPTYDAHSAVYQARYEQLSRSYRGYVCTTSLVDETFSMGEFTYCSMAKSRNSKLKFLRFFWFCVRLALSLLKKRDRIDLVVSYDPLMTGLVALVVTRILGAKFVSEVPGVYASEKEWVDDKSKWESKVKKRLYPKMMKMVLKRADGIQLRYEGQLESLGEIEKGKVVTVLNGFVLIDKFVNLPEEKEVLFVGFPFRRKGADILIDAFKTVAPKFPEWKLKILGWFSNMDEVHAAIGGHPQIYHHPPVNHSEMPKHIGSCAILVVPSRSEALARVLIEGMAAGKPRIGSDVDGIPTIISHGVDGLLFKSESVEALANNLELLLRNEPLRKQLGQAGRERARKEFSGEVYFRKLHTFYDQILEKR